MFNILAEYNNGNTFVQVYEDGTKVRQYAEIAVPAFPESIDVKITDYCDMGCSYCHEQSTRQGIHGNLNILLDKLKSLPAGVEIACGGGNPLSHPDLIPFLIEAKERGLIVNMTINQGHLKPFYDKMRFLIKSNLIRGIGISVTNYNYKYIEELIKFSDHIVYHLIAGINNVEEVYNLIKLNKKYNKDCKILLLGYKVFGFGVEYYEKEQNIVQKNLKEWYGAIRSLIGKCTLSFDNLAIQQLKIRRLFTEEGWERFYMGDDFQFSMYIDAVKKEYAPTSRSKERVSFNDMGLVEFFQTFK